ncbi:MAG: GTPase Era [Chitinophagales bacterium]|jgi:GTP-binding protein Era|nr:GTPase Era [Chitinophagales bacterium]
MAKKQTDLKEVKVTKHHSGFVNIFGLPNVGKSTLLNALLNEKISIVTPKAQTTRKRIIGIWNDPRFQVVFNDTPGILEPHYKLQESMANVIQEAMQDVDIALFLIEANMNEMAAKAQFDQLKFKVPVILVLNKIDQITEPVLRMKMGFWAGVEGIKEVVPVSALKKRNLDILKAMILKYLPEGPAFYDKEHISDRNVRFFMSDFIREKIFLYTHDEIPYHTEVVVVDYKEKEDIDVITAEIYVNRESHKSMLIGKGGALIKRISTEARADMEKFLGKKVFLDTRVKVKENWIDNERSLKSFGY